LTKQAAGEDKAEEEIKTGRLSVMPGKDGVPRPSAMIDHSGLDSIGKDYTVSKENGVAFQLLDLTPAVAAGSRHSVAIALNDDVIYSGSDNGDDKLKPDFKQSVRMSVRQSLMMPVKAKDEGVKRLSVADIKGMNKDKPRQSTIAIVVPSDQTNMISLP